MIAQACREVLGNNYVPRTYDACCSIRDLNIEVLQPPYLCIPADCVPGMGYPSQQCAVAAVLQGSDIHPALSPANSRVTLVAIRDCVQF